MQENLQGYMLDKRARDQFAIRHGDITEVMWNDPQRLSAESVRGRGPVPAVPCSRVHPCHRIGSHLWHSSTP